MRTQAFGCAAVQRVWTQAKPTADFAWKKYLGVHDVVVVSYSALDALSLVT